MFPIIGVAADDLFIFLDAWRQSETIDKRIINSRERRLAYTFRRATRAMATTSSTTAAAFVANYFSKIMPIRSASIFGTVIIPMNFLLVVFVFTPAVIFYEDRVKGMPSIRTLFQNRCSTRMQKISIDEFFGTTWNSAVKKYRYVIFIVSLAWTGFAISQAIKIGPLTEPEVQVSRDHPSQTGFNAMEYNFTSDNFLDSTISLYFGVSELDDSDTSQWDRTNMSQPILDVTFNPYSKESQLFLLDMCGDLKSQPKQFVIPGTVSCWLEDFDLFLKSQKKSCHWNPSRNSTNS